MTAAQASARELGTLGGARSAEEVAAAARDAAGGAVAWIDRLRDAGVAALVKCAPRVHPHLVGRAGDAS